MLATRVVPFAAPARRPPMPRALSLPPRQLLWDYARPGDAAERMRVGDGAAVCWLRLVDECTGAFLRTTVFPPGRLERGAAGPDAGGVAAGPSGPGAARGGGGGERAPPGG